MLENQYSDATPINQFVKSLQNQQEPNGSWNNHFDTGQVVEALVRAKAPTEWELDFDGTSVKGGLEKTALWIERTQSRYGNWDGSTWSTMYALRAYLLASKAPKPRTVNLAINWILENGAVKNHSWFHVIEHSSSGIVTLNKTLQFLKNSNLSDLNADVTLRILIADIKEYQAEQAKVEVAEQLEQEGVRQQLRLAQEETRKAIDQKNELRDKFNELRKTVIWGLIVGFILFLIVALYIGFVLNQNLTSFIIGIIGIILGVISLYVSQNTQPIEQKPKS